MEEPATEEETTRIKDLHRRTRRLKSRDFATSYRKKRAAPAVRTNRALLACR